LASGCIFLSRETENLNGARLVGGESHLLKARKARHSIIVDQLNPFLDMAAGRRRSVDPLISTFDD
jgi:hypothetical protein